MRLLLCPAFAAAVASGTVMAQTTDRKPAPLARTPLVTHAITPSQQVSSVPVTRLDFAPGQPTGRHLHPMPVIGYVLQGEFIVKVEGQPEHRYRTGESVYEPANVTIERFDNASNTERAVLIAHYLAGPGQTELIRFLAN